MLLPFRPMCCTLECVHSAVVAYIRRPSSFCFLRPASVFGVADSTLKSCLGCLPYCAVLGTGGIIFRLTVRVEVRWVCRHAESSGSKLD
jgi:hypothetical protein